MALSACVQSLQALSLHKTINSSECLDIFKEAADNLAEALDTKKPSGSSGFPMTPEPAQKLTKAMIGVYEWMQGMIELWERL